jgi:hypothetical protein
MRFKDKANFPHGSIELVETVPAVLSPTHVIISKEKCQNAFQVCSAEVGSMEGNAFVIHGNAAN